MQINYLVNYSCVRVRSGLSARIIPSIAIRQTKRICRHLPPPVPVPRPSHRVGANFRIEILYNCMNVNTITHFFLLLSFNNFSLQQIN